MNTHLRNLGWSWLFLLAAPLAACSTKNDTNTPDQTGDDSGVVDGSVSTDGGLKPAPSAKNPPAKGAYFGAFVGVGNNDQNDFTAEEQLIGRTWVIDNRFYSFEDWINDRTKWDIAQNKIPLVTWEPHEPLDEIIAGKHDDMLHQRAQGAKALGVEIFLRWGHEMNGNWYPWSGAQNGGSGIADAGAGSDSGDAGASEAGSAEAGSGGSTMTGPEKYIAAWHHVHDLFVADGATNVVWIWCPLVDDVPAEPWNHWTKYYPGDDYVDWVGLDAYNWGSSSSCCTWESFDDLVDSLYSDYAGKKPLMLPETASAEVGGSKSAWINEMRGALKTKYTAIHAVVWFDINKETDWRIASSPATLAAYKAMALDPYFNP